MTFAKNTNVQISKSKTELEALLIRYKASQRVFGTDDTTGSAFVVFTLGADENARQVRLKIPLPPLSAFATKMRKGASFSRTQTPQQQAKAWDQACRERWRAIVLVTKAKLELIQMGASTVEREFLADIRMTNGKTVGEQLEKLLADSNRNGPPPLLLGE